MTIALNRLTIRDVEIAAPGQHADGGGLYLAVTPAGSRSWLFVFRFGGRRPEMGLGSWPAIPLTRARQLAAQARSQLAEGQNPLALKRKPSESPTFATMAEQVITDLDAGWKSRKHAGQWRSTLTAYTKPIANVPVNEIDTDAVMKCLRPIWKRIPDTASRVRGRIEAVLNAAKAHGYRSGENPAAWKGHLDHLLPARQKLGSGHHAAMNYDDVPAFVSRLRSSDGLSRRALEFTILTASRTSEVLGARWGEIDIRNAVWTVPAIRMKGNRIHRVPLSTRAVEILREVEPLGQEFVFPGQSADRPLSSMSMDMLLRRMNVTDATVHGFRSSFRDWAGDETNHQREVIEAALAHVIGDKAEAAYRRGDALRKRRVLMDEWAGYVTRTSRNVVSIAAERLAREAV